MLHFIPQHERGEAIASVNRAGVVVVVVGGGGVTQITVFLSYKHCSTSTETTLRAVRDGEPRTVTSTFTQLLSSETILSSSGSVLLYVHRDHKDY